MSKNSPHCPLQGKKNPAGRKKGKSRRKKKGKKKNKRESPSARVVFQSVHCAAAQMAELTAHGATGNMSNRGRDCFEGSSDGSTDECVITAWMPLTSLYRKQTTVLLSKWQKEIRFPNYRLVILAQIHHGEVNCNPCSWPTNLQTEIPYQHFTQTLARTHGSA